MVVIDSRDLFVLKPALSLCTASRRTAIPEGMSSIDPVDPRLGNLEVCFVARYRVKKNSDTMENDFR